MTLSYVHWALIGMVCYSLTSLFTKFATASGFSSFMVLALAVTIVGTSTWAIVIARGEFPRLTQNLLTPPALWSYATGIVLAVAVSALFKALSLGPASVVVPIYGMFAAGGAVLGLLFLHESLNLTKASGIAAAVLGIYLISRS